MENKSTSAEPAAPPRLRCLDGRPPPPEISADLRLCSSLPESAQSALWTALGPSLKEPMPPSMEAELDAFCSRHAAPRDRLARVLRACRFLVREAAKRDLPLAAFVEDVAALAGPTAPVTAILAAGYENAYVILRREMLREALVAGGSVLTGVEWRVDAIRAASNGVRASAPVALMTLKYVDGDRPARLVLHMPLATVAELKRACEEILSQ